MRVKDINKVKSLWNIDTDALICSIHKISAVNNPRAGGRTHTVENKRSGKKTAIWLDEVIAQWVDLDGLKERHQPMPHRIDGCYLNDEDIFLLEFKADGNLENLKDDIWAKYHDTYAILVDHDLISLNSAREHLYYIVISCTQLKWSKDDFDENTLKGMSEREKSELFLSITTPMSNMIQRPWRHAELLPKANLRDLTASTSKAAWTFDTMQFDRFVEEMHWV